MWPMSAGLRLVGRVTGGRNNHVVIIGSPYTYTVRVGTIYLMCAIPVCGVKRAQVGAQQALQLPGELALSLQDVLQDLCERAQSNTHKQCHIYDAG